MSLINKAVLTLNASFEPVSIMRARNAVKLLVKGSAVAEEDYGVEVYPGVPLPSVIRLRNYKKNSDSDIADDPAKHLRPGSLLMFVLWSKRRLYSDHQWKTNQGDSDIGPHPPRKSRRRVLVGQLSVMLPGMQPKEG